MTNKLESIQNYSDIRCEIAALLDAAHSASARSVNAIMTATHWEIGQRIVESEQRGAQRAESGEQLVKQLSKELTIQFGRGFSQPNLWKMRAFFWHGRRKRFSRYRQENL